MNCVARMRTFSVFRSSRSSARRSSSIRLSLIPEPVARRNNIIAYSHKGDELEVAMLDTDDLAAIDFIKKKTHLKVLPRLTDEASIKSALKQYQQGLKDNLGDVIKRETEALKVKAGAEVKDEDLKQMAQDVPAVRIVDYAVATRERAERVRHPHGAA